MWPIPCRLDKLHEHAPLWRQLMLAVCPVAWQRRHTDAARTCVQTGWSPAANRLVMIKRGQMHNREIIRTRPLCMNPSTSTQLCQTAWSIIFSNSCGLESDYWAPSVAQTSVAKQVTSWLFTNISPENSSCLVRIWCRIVLSLPVSY